MTQKEFLSSLLKDNQDAIIIGSLGTISYDMKDIPHPNKIMIKGAMGCVMGVGLGYALNTDKRVIVVIGDGSYLMKAGSVATIKRHNPSNLKVIILDNNCYKSCGGQKTNFEYVKPEFETIRVS
jgi:thiamine pyrophosphate-dependent acetolactate synthase large subunit-like protein